MSQDFNIFIISLTTATERQESCARQLDKLNLAYEIKLFKRTETIEVDEYNRGKRLRKYGYDLLSGEIGAFLSHREIWRMAAESSKPTLILEDDFLVEDHSFPNHIADMVDKIDTLGIVRFQAIFEKKTQTVTKIFDLDLVTYSGNPSGATAYMVSPQSAQTLYNRTKEIFIPVDDFIDHEWRHGMVVHGLIPYPISTTEAHSEIGTRNKPEQGILVKLRIEINKLPDSLRGKWFYLTHHFFKL